MWVFVATMHWWMPIIVAVVVILVEHVSRLFGIKYRPSWALSVISNEAVRAARWIGRTLAHVSSFYTYLQLHELGKTVVDLLVPCIRLLLSPFQVLYGYGQAAIAYEHAYLIAGGTMTLLLTPFLMSPTVRAWMWNTLIVRAWTWTSFQQWCLDNKYNLATVVTPIIGGVILFGFFIYVSDPICSGGKSNTHNTRSSARKRNPATTSSSAIFCSPPLLDGQHELASASSAPAAAMSVEDPFVDTPLLAGRRTKRASGR